MKRPPLEPLHSIRLRTVKLFAKRSNRFARQLPDRTDDTRKIKNREAKYVPVSFFFQLYDSLGVGGTPLGVLDLL